MSIICLSCGYPRLNLDKGTNQLCHGPQINVLEKIASLNEEIVKLNLMLSNKEAQMDLRQYETDNLKGEVKKLKKLLRNKK